ncbi:hypothetical protein MTR_2g054220 [Medicago truncatula]|uniref:DUF4283 domain protein n=1 Tax=Medicago truncatula TaxID=3880 RepID=G7IQJ3_MEDTR|nr:hypothetical protein MTR_2g054220 [Medicago truncatula]
MENDVQWKMLPLGRGYYEFSFASFEDLRSVWAMGTINLKPGILRLFEWIRILIFGLIHHLVP